MNGVVPRRQKKKHPLQKKRKKKRGGKGEKRIIFSAGGPGCLLLPRREDACFVADVKGARPSCTLEGMVLVFAGKDKKKKTFACLSWGQGIILIQ